MLFAWDPNKAIANFRKHRIASRSYSGVDASGHIALLL
jgi:hypothetical protein